ncbi:MAG: site-2 protease family protein [Dehalococcoidales bacterium]|nr:site-2 protease family protein [Dehalococcoidales bacterium]
MVIYIIIGFLVLSVILISHELGHFFTAKMTGVKVEEFGLGYPPRIWGFRWGETLYSINWIPFGGFTKMTGEEDPSDPRSLASKNRWARLLVITGGTLVNILLAYILFSTSFLFPQNTYEGDVRVEDVSENSPAEAAGLVIGDFILSAEGEPVRNGNTLSRIISENLGEPITLEVEHADSTVTFIDLIPREDPPAGEGHVGVLTLTANASVTTFRYPAWQVFWLGLKEMGSTVSMWATGLVSIFSGDSPASFVGPVALVQLTGEVAEYGVVPVLRVAALISLILGITNLFPIPALDGSRVVFLIIEKIRKGKRLKPQTEGMVHFIGFALLIILLFIITFQDILRIINGESLLG